MARDYEIIHYLQAQMIALDPKLTSAIVRMHTRLSERKMYSSALSTSVTLFLAMRYLELSPKLILGTIQFQGLSYPHAWIELDGKIFDLATHQDIQHHPVLKEKELTLINPMVNINYEDASRSVCYYPFQFEDLWQLANLYKMVGKTFEMYIDESLYIDILADVCYILEISETPETLDFFRAVAKLETIKDKNDTYDVRESEKVEENQNDSSSSPNTSNVAPTLFERFKKMTRKRERKQIK